MLRNDAKENYIDTNIDKAEDVETDRKKVEDDKEANK